MDPWHQHRNEPKAPDKKTDPLSDGDNNIIMNIKPEKSFSNSGKSDEYTASCLLPKKNSSVSSLDELGLKALLEEAMAYKRPKDVQGKSDLFKELLQSVESENKFPVVSIRDRPEKQGNRKPRRKQVNKKEAEKNSQEASYQDLIVHVTDCETTLKQQVKYSVKCAATNLPQVVPVSPANVCHENNPEVAAILRNGSFENLEQLQKFIANEANVYQIKTQADSSLGLPLSMCSYREKNCDEVEAPPDDSLKILRHSVAPISSKENSSVPLISKDAIPETKKSLDENGNAVGSVRFDALAEKKAKARRLKAKNDKNTILSQHIEGHRSDIAQDIDALMKYIESPKLAGEPKTPRQRNVSVGLSKQGIRIGSKVRPARDKSSDTLSRKNKKSKDEKLHKCNSLEEVSISKFEDLTKSDLPDKKITGTRYSGVNATSQNISDSTKPRYENILNVRLRKKEFNYQSDICDQEDPVDADFHTVTKKNRKKRSNIYGSNMRSKTIKGTRNYRSEKSLCSYCSKSQELGAFDSSDREFQRRKSVSSVPSSDKSGDTSDMDSVHSFPVSANKGRGLKNNVSMSISSTPQISYADITRSAPSPVRTHYEISSKVDENSYPCEETSKNSTFEPVPTVILRLPSRREEIDDNVNVNKLDDEYPPLKKNESNDMFIEFTVVVPKRSLCHNEMNSIDVEETVLIKMPQNKIDNSVKEVTSDIVNNQLSSKRPPVILMNGYNVDSSAVNDLVFGFEVNEQLLYNSDLETFESSGFVEIDEIKSSIVENGISVDQDNSDRTKSAIQVEDSKSIVHFSCDQIVEYVSSEWQLVMAELRNCKDSRIQYFCP